MTIAAAMLTSSPAVAAEPARILIRDVTVIDGTGAPPVAHRDVLLSDGRIAAITPHKPGSQGAIVIEGAGKYLAPGLIDAHVHIVGGAFRRGRDLREGQPNDEASGIRALQGYLHAGFTTVYDAGNDGPYIFGLRARQQAGEFASPRLLASGFYFTAVNGRGARESEAHIGEPLLGGAEGARQLDVQIALKPDVQKFTYEAQGVGPNPLIPRLDLEVMKTSVAYLHAKGIKSTVHVSGEAAARDAIDAGIDSLAHVPPSGVLSAEFVKLMADRQIPVATTMVVFDEIISLANDPAFLRDPLFTGLVDPAELDDRRANGPRYKALGWPTYFAAIAPYLQRNVRALNDAGAVLALGTDKSFAPFAVREMQLLAEAGIKPLQIIRISTLNAARFIGREKDLGSVETGKIADLILLGADPSHDIANIRTVETVIQGGRIVDRKALDLPINGRAQ